MSTKSSSTNSSSNAKNNHYNTTAFYSLDTLWGASLSVALTLANYKVFMMASFALGCLINILSLRNSHLINCIVSILSNYNQKGRLSSVLIHTAASVLASVLLERRFKKSFKLGENILLSQLISTLVLASWNVQFRSWSAFFLLANILPILKTGTFATNATWIVLCAAFTLNKGLVDPLYSEIFGNPQLIAYWTVILCLILYLPAAFPYSAIFSSQNSMRKFYHFAAVGLFIPAAFWSLNVLKIALATAATLFIHIETLRVDSIKKNNSFIVERLNAFMERCRNDLDKGDMVLSHLYLLLGCAIPFWLNDSLKLSSFSGVISLGIGDSLASIGGKAFGQSRWHRLTRKTMEGSFCACLGMFGSWIVLNQLGGFRASLKLLFMASFWPAMWEALIDLNDNLTLPLFTLILINSCT